MKKMLTSALSAIMCISCLSANMAVFAETSEPALLIESDKFTYLKEAKQSKPLLTIHNDELQGDEFQEIYVVTAISRDDAGKPTSYYLDDNNATTFPVNRASGMWSAKEAEELLGRELAIGDVIACSEFVAYETMLPDLSIQYAIEEYEKDPDAYFAAYGYVPYVKYLGKGTEFLGDDFKYVLCEMIAGPQGSMERLKGYSDMFVVEVPPVDYGDANIDGKVNIMDVINVNRNIMIGAPLTAYGTLAADVNKDGVVDAVDSLNMLKGVVGLVDFAELG